MKEIDQINNNNKGEIPDSNYDVVIVKNISDPDIHLSIFKKTIITFLENKELDWEDRKWEEILPVEFVRFTNQIEDNDYRDELLSNIPNIIDGLQDVKEWVWFSSELTSKGFKVYMKGIFRTIFLPILHHQGIPHKSLFIEREGIEYPIVRSGIDVLTYRSWNPETYELK